MYDESSICYNNIETTYVRSCCIDLPRRGRGTTRTCGGWGEATEMRWSRKRNYEYRLIQEADLFLTEQPLYLSHITLRFFKKSVYNPPKVWYNISATQSDLKHPTYLLDPPSVHFYSMIKMYAQFCTLGDVCICRISVRKLCRSNRATFFVRGFGCALFI